MDYALVTGPDGDGMLDNAVWRRFEEVLFLRPPTAAQVRRLLSVKLRGVRYDFDIKDVVERGWFADATHADVERVVRRAVKAMVLEGGESRLRLDHLDAARRRTADTDGIPEFLGYTYVVPQCVEAEVNRQLMGTWPSR